MRRTELRLESIVHKGYQAAARDRDFLISSYLAILFVNLLALT